MTGAWPAAAASTSSRTVTPARRSWSPQTATPRDYDELFEDVARRAASLPVFIAPVTPMGGCEAPTLDHLVEVVEHARELELDIRVLPQVHRAMGIA